MKAIENHALVMQTGDSYTVLNRQVIAQINLESGLPVIISSKLLEIFSSVQPVAGFVDEEFLHELKLFMQEKIGEVVLFYFLPIGCPYAKREYIRKYVNMLILGGQVPDVFGREWVQDIFTSMQNDLQSEVNKFLALELTWGE